ncbi:LEM domain-containing protein 1 isoform 2-T2 [Menidia menidia]
MPFVDDPAHLSKTRLKSDLIAHNVELPPAASKKEAYVELHLRHIDQTNAAEFSSDDEEPVQEVAEKEEVPEVAEMPDPSTLTDDDLKATLLKHGVKAGPIVASTRMLYERKLKSLVRSGGHGGVNGAEKAALYSDSEEEEDEGNGDEEDKESGLEHMQQEAVEEQTQQQSSEAKMYFQRGEVSYPQCFSLSTRLRACSVRNKACSSTWNSRNASQSSKTTQSRCSQIPVGISRASSIGQHSGLSSRVPPQSVVSNGCSSTPPQPFSITQMVEEMESQSSLSPSADKELNRSNMLEHWSWSNRPAEQIADKYRITEQSLYYTPKDSPRGQGTKLSEEPETDILKDLIPEIATTPTGIFATSRRPIKGAAQRPVQYAYPDTPVSPVTLERREVERRLVPIHVQILVFLTLAFILYFIYVHVEDSSSVLSLLDGFSHWSDTEEGALLQAELQET